MERLTTKTSIMGRKHDLAYGCASIWKKKLSKHYRYNLIEEAVDKLGQLEDIEEELGIDLITLGKALKEGVYTIHSNGERRIPCLAYNGAVGYILDFMYEQEAQYILSDYGKTWWLEKPKDELEND